MTAIVLRGDARRLPLPDASVDLIVTSPPYFGLRSYTDGGGHYDGQIGSEASPGEWVAALVACTAEWVRVLKPSGSLFVNLGDKYAGDSRPGSASTSTLHTPRVGSHAAATGGRRVPGVPKSLLGLPWRYALACMDELGLILRRDIIWSKPNGLPESVTDRCRSSHEYLFHFTVRPRYYAAVDEIREEHAAHTLRYYPPGGSGQPRGGKSEASRDAGVWHKDAGRTGLTSSNPLGKLPGSVWEIPSQPLSVPAHLGVDHFAAFPMELPRRVILGWSPPGVCTACGEGRRPVVTRERAADDRQRIVLAAEGRTRRLGATSGLRSRPGPDGYPATTITGYACGCPDATAPVRPAVVVDPFCGTGTTMLTASALGRIGIGVDRSADYCRLARWRCSDPGERAKALQVPKPPPVPDGQASLFDDLEAS